SGLGILRQFFHTLSSYGIPTLYKGISHHLNTDDCQFSFRLPRFSNSHKLLFKKLEAFIW
ncbi:MAG: hypothetical protein II651_02560, partial [Selenomonas sp.]|nr:hypothetical protein [Selenomonas sp.]